MESPDPYEAKYMEGGTSIARASKSMPAHYHFVFAVPITAVLVAALATSFYPLLALVLLLAFPWVLFMRIRLNVTSEHVHVQLGLAGPKIPIASIEAVRVEIYDAKKYGSKVVKTASDGSTAYYVAGGAERGVRVEWRDEQGKKRSIFASCEEAPEIVAAIERVRAGRVRARVGAADPPDPEAEQAAEESDRRGRDARARKASREAPRVIPPRRHASSFLTASPLSEAARRRPSR